MNKDLILKIAKEKDLKSFYKKYPTQEAFMKAHGKAFEKAQFGNMFKGFNPGNTQMPSGVGYSPMSTSLTSSGFQMPDAAGAFAKANPLPTNIPNMKVPNSIGGAGSKMPGAGQALGVATDIINAAGAFKQQKNKLKDLRQQKGVTDVGLQAAKSIDVDAVRQRQDSAAKAREAIMQPFDGGSLYPVNGVGTNVLARNGMMLEDGGEIQNTYDPDTIYDDLGYEPLEDSTQVKQYRGGGFVKAQGGFSSFMGAGGTDFANKAVGNAFDNNAGSQMGTAVGNAVSIIPGVGPVVGAVAAPVLGAIGGVLDNAFGDAGKIKKQQQAVDRNIQDMSNVNQAKSITGSLSAMGVGRNGLYLEDEEINSFRAGGHLRAYKDPSEEAMQTFAMGGELQTHWGGHMEEMSENPYLPDGGVTYMPHGQSHEEADGNGRTGIGITYGDNPVEVERREPIMKLKDGSTGEDNLVVFGNLEIPKYGVEMLGDKKAKGMKFKNYVANLSKSETKQNKTIQKSTEELADLNPTTSFDKLKFAGLQANVLGGNMKLKEIAQTKEKAAALQNAINDTAEEMGVDADSLAKGRIKTAKMGGEFSKAQTGIDLPKVNDKDYTYLKELYNKAKAAKKGPDVLKFQQEYHRLASPYAKKVLESENVTKLGKSKQYQNTDLKSNEDQLFGKRTARYMQTLDEGYKKNNENILPINSADNVDMNAGELNEVLIEPKFNFRKALKTFSGDMTPDLAQFESAKLPNSIYHKDMPIYDDYEEVVNDTKEPTDLNPYMTALNSIIPMLRPSDAEPLNANQLYGEMYALSNNQEEPVQAQTYNPQLASLYSISLQDQMNEITAQTRAAQKMAQGNPAAQAVIAAQAYEAINKIKGEEFKVNQDRFDKTYASNIDTLNDSQLKNLAIGSKQAADQAAARSNTKAINQAALQSISDKYLQNDAANRKLQIAENTYNYRYDSKGRLINMNPFQQFSPSGAESRTGGKGLAPGYEFTYDADQNIIGTRKGSKEDVGKHGAKVKAKNGSIVKAMRNL